MSWYEPQSTSNISTTTEVKYIFKPNETLTSKTVKPEKKQDRKKGKTIEKKRKSNSETRKIVRNSPKKLKTKETVNENNFI